LTSWDILIINLQRDENQDLREKLGDQVETEKKKTRKEKAGVDIDREKELLQTIERIKGKLRRSITKKMQEERIRQYKIEDFLEA